MPSRQFRPQTTFDADLRRLVRIDPTILDDVKAAIELLLEDGNLPAEFRDHSLQRRWSGYREFHLRDAAPGTEPTDINDVLVIYKWSNNNLILVGVRMGSHGRLFGD